MATLPVGASSLHEYSIEHSVAKLVVSGTISKKWGRMGIA
jgi:hypothetical protein